MTYNKTRIAEEGRMTPWSLPEQADYLRGFLIQMAAAGADGLAKASQLLLRYHDEELAHRERTAKPLEEGQTAPEPAPTWAEGHMNLVTPPAPAAAPVEKPKKAKKAVAAADTPPPPAAAK